MNDYQLIFDAAASGYSTWRAATVPAGVALFSLLLTAFAPSAWRVRESRELRWYRLLTGSIAGLAGVASLGILAHTWREYDTLRNALRRREFRVVEGKVSNFVPEGLDGHPTEKFQLGNIRFQYSTSDITSAFHRTAARGGPIHDGLRVRIAEVDGAIARLEVAR